jgi:hypothetical protein
MADVLLCFRVMQILMTSKSAKCEEDGRQHQTVRSHLSGADAPARENRTHLQSCCRANPLPHPGHSHTNGRSSVWERRWPVRDERVQSDQQKKSESKGGSTSEIEPARERAAAAGDRAHEVRLVPSPARGGGLGCRCRDLLLFYLEDWRQPGHRWEGSEMGRV